MQNMINQWAEETPGRKLAVPLFMRLNITPSNIDCQGFEGNGQRR